MSNKVTEVLDFPITPVTPIAPKHVESRIAAPEPWEYRENGSDNGFDGYFAVPGQPRETGLIDHNHPANSARIVACVNGCAGIPDPETTVPKLIAAVALAANQASILAARETDPEERTRYQEDEAYFRTLLSAIPAKQS